MVHACQQINSVFLRHSYSLQPTRRILAKTIALQGFSFQWQSHPYKPKCPIRPSLSPYGDTDKTKKQEKLRATGLKDLQGSTTSRANFQTISRHHKDLSSRRGSIRCK
ncbi:MAG: hypothetical protein AB7U29_07840 [Desulfobulbus sp.]